MKKKMVFIICSVAIFVILSIILLILMAKEIISNPFIDTSDLVCSRTITNNTELFYFEFNWIGKVKKAEKLEYIYFETIDGAQAAYNYYIEEKINNVKIEDNSLIFSYNILGNQIETSSYRKQILKDYYSYGFECK